MGKWVLIWGGIALVAWLVSVVIGLQQKRAGAKFREQAQARLQAGDWESAAACYKRAILERLDSSGALLDLVDELETLYSENGVDADLSQIHDGPRLIKKIWNTKASPKERGRLTGKLYAQMAEVLDEYPGEIEA